MKKYYRCRDKKNVWNKVCEQQLQQQPQSILQTGHPQK
jgi:hypothetical protein